MPSLWQSVAFEDFGGAVKNKGNKRRKTAQTRSDVANTTGTHHG